MTLRILHLVGSAESDFYADLSRLYARDCLSANADPDRYEFHIAYVTPDKIWRFPTDLSDAAIAAAAGMILPEAITFIVGLHIDVMLPQMFCIPGMTYYRGLFDLLGVPYLGNAPDVMAIGSNKALAKAVVAAAGVPVPRGEVIRAGTPLTPPPFALPWVVKPVDTDNSLGLGLVTAAADYPAALAAAFRHTDAVLVEKFVSLGREVRCGVVVRDGELVCLPLEEYDVDAATKPIRTQADKISGASGSLALVAKEKTRAWIVDTADPITERVWQAAKQCHLALGCRDYSLFDFRVDPAGEPWFLEAGLYCSYARTSVISMMAEAGGIPLADLFDDGIRQALRR